MPLNNQLSRCSVLFATLILLCTGCAKKYQTIILPTQESNSLSEQELHVKYSRAQEERDKESIDQILRSETQKDMYEAIHKACQH